MFLNRLSVINSFELVTIPIDSQFLINWLFSPTLITPKYSFWSPIFNPISPFICFKSSTYNLPEELELNIKLSTSL